MVSMARTAAGIGHGRANGAGESDHLSRLQRKGEGEIMASVIFVRWPIPDCCTHCGKPFEPGKEIALSPYAAFHIGLGTNCLAAYTGYTEDF
jgi:hypothetical protein